MGRDVGALSRWIVASIAVVHAACNSTQPRVRVGHKDFAEQVILAEIAVHLLSVSGWRASAVDCGDTFGCQRALRAGDIDVMVEYTGTAHLHSGAAATGQVSLENLRASYGPLGIDWLDPLGFDNGYRVVLLRSVAAANGIQTIADLGTRLAGPLSVACPPTYLLRSGDGLAALAQRHGFATSADPLTTTSVDERVDALRSGRADIAIAYATDSVLEKSDLFVLDDSLQFFPPYEAALMVRSELRNTHPGAVDVLAQLGGQIDDHRMRALGHAAEIEGWAPRALAHRFLEEAQLLPESTAVAAAKPMPLAAPTPLPSPAIRERATRAVRAAFPGRPAQVVAVEDVRDALGRGRARLAIAGAEDFFYRDAGLWARRTDIEAIGALGVRMVHLVRRAGDSRAAAGIGAPRADIGDGRIVELALGAAGPHPVMRGDTETLAAAFVAGDIDGFAVVAEPGDPTIAKALATGGELRALSVSDTAASAPFLRPTRIPAAAYQTSAPVDSVGTQMVIAAPAPHVRPGVSVGPAAALGDSALPLSPDEIMTIARATGVAEAPDPVLPSALGADRGVAPEISEPRVSRIHTVLNILAVGFWVWLFMLVSRRGPAQAS